MSLTWQISLIIIFAIILVSIQYTLNKLLVAAREIIALLHLLINRK